MSNRRVILHVGAPKTGSTYVQKRLHANTAALAAQQIAYPELWPTKGLSANAKLLPIVIEGVLPPIFQRRFPHIALHDFDAAQLTHNLLAPFEQGARVVILSAENMRAQHTEALRALLPTDLSIQVVLTVRRQDNWFSSLFSQRLKHQHTARTPSAELANRMANGFQPQDFPDWAVQYQTWCDVFGSCNVLFYEETKRDLFGSFLRAAGIDDLGNFRDIPRQNSSISAFECAYLLSITEPLPYETFQGHRRRAQKAAEGLGLLTPGVSFLSPDDLQSLRQAFSASNSALLAATGRQDLAAQFDIPVKAAQFMDIEAIYATPEYARFKAVLDQK